MKKLSENAKKIIKLLIVIVTLATISVGIYLILYACGLTDKETISNWLIKWGELAWAVFILVRVGCTIFLSFVPACSMAFDAIAIMLFGSMLHYTPGKVFLICFTSVVLASCIMDVIGRFGGSKAIIKLVGKKDYDSALELVQEKGIVYVPVMYLLPVFPDDAICLVAGATKIKFWIHLIYIVLFRGIGCATVVFGVSFIPEGVRTFTSPYLWDYIQVLTVIVFWVLVIFRVAGYIDKWLTKKLKEKRAKRKLEENEEEAEAI